jgi:hypothetical protein
VQWLFYAASGSIIPYQATTGEKSIFGVIPERRQQLQHKQDRQKLQIHIGFKLPSGNIQQSFTTFEALAQNQHHFTQQQQQQQQQQKSS